MTEFKQFSTADHGISNEAQVSALSQGWSKNSWLDVLKKTLKTMEATDDLAMCGIVVDFGFKKMEEVAADSAIAKYHDGSPVVCETLPTGPIVFAHFVRPKEKCFVFFCWV